jgi:tetratricopeptide (TPR) repeat protein
MAPHPGRGLVAVLTEDVWQEASYGRPEEYRPHLERAEQAADDADIAPPHRLLEIRGGMEITTGDVETGLRHIREAAERALADGEATVAASILNDLGSVSHRYATMEAAIAACDEAIAITQERGLDPMIGPGPRTSALMHLGRWDEVVAETPRLIQIASERGNLFMAEGLWIPLARVLLDRGEPELIEEELFEPERFSMRSDARSWAIHVRLHVPRGDIDLEPMRALIEADEMIPMPMLMETLIEIDAIDLAEAFRRSFIGRPMEEPWVDGLLSEGRGEWHEAQQAFETTLEYFRRVGSVFIEADLQARIGRCALELGDLATARERLTRSRELWVGMRANARIADVDALLARL